jgi:hypothetical protein
VSRVDRRAQRQRLRLCDHDADLPPG